MSDNNLREQICIVAKSLYDRGLAHGSTGNISVRCDDGGLLVTPTNSSFGFLDPDALTKLDSKGHQVDGPAPTKELPLHTAFYETRIRNTGAVLHLHSHYSVALSMMPDIDPDNLIKPLTPYPVMKLGRVKLLPYFRPGDPEMGNAVRDLRGQHSAVVLANHGPVVAGEDLMTTLFAMEELEAAARLAIETQGKTVRLLSKEQIQALISPFQD